jgi:hypothetical protein
MAVISAGEKKFHRLIQRHTNALDRELIASKFNLSVRTVQDIAHGRINNIAVLTDLVEYATKNLEVERLQLSEYRKDIAKENSNHFNIRKKMGVPDGVDGDKLESDGREVK